MLRLSMLIFMGLITIGCDDDIPSSEIPSVVKNTFKSKFHNATDVEWENYGDDFEVDFEMNAIDYSARIDYAGNLLEYKYEIARNSLPAPIFIMLENEYSKISWEDPEILVCGQNSYYQLESDGFFKDTKIVMDSTGNKIDIIKFWN